MTSKIELYHLLMEASPPPYADIGPNIDASGKNTPILSSAEEMAKNKANHIDKSPSSTHMLTSTELIYERKPLMNRKTSQRADEAQNLFGISQAIDQNLDRSYWLAKHEGALLKLAHEVATKQILLHVHRHIQQLFPNEHISPLFAMETVGLLFFEIYLILDTSASMRFNGERNLVLALEQLKQNLYILFTMDPELDIFFTGAQDFANNRNTLKEHYSMQKDPSNWEIIDSTLNLYKEACSIDTNTPLAETIRKATEFAIKKAQIAGMKSTSTTSRILGSLKNKFSLSFEEPKAKPILFQIVSFSAKDALVLRSVFHRFRTAKTADHFREHKHDHGDLKWAVRDAMVDGQEQLKKTFKVEEDGFSYFVRKVGSDEDCEKFWNAMEQESTIANHLDSIADYKIEIRGMLHNYWPEDPSFFPPGYRRPNVYTPQHDISSRVYQHMHALKMWYIANHGGAGKAVALEGSDKLANHVYVFHRLLYLVRQISHKAFFDGIDETVASQTKCGTCNTVHVLYDTFLTGMGDQESWEKGRLNRHGIMRKHNFHNYHELEAKFGNSKEHSKYFTPLSSNHPAHPVNHANFLAQPNSRPMSRDGGNS